MSGPLGLPSGDQILRYAVRGTAGVIGLASEGIHARKERKQHEKELKQQKHDGELSREDSSVSVQSDTHAKSVRSVDSEDAVSPVDPEYLGTTDELWELDSAQDQLIHTEHTPAAEVSPDDVDGHVRALEDSFLEAHKDHGRYPLKPEGGHLDLPVIVPQRRPQNRARGFVRAYAPELEKVGIDCDMWLNFLDTFETASQASPWLNCINFAGFAGMAAPHPVSFAISVALTLAVKEVMDLQSRQRINKFLLKINEEFFQPRGLFCLVMTWKPDSDQLFETVDINATINSAMTSYNSGFTNKFKQSQGTTYGDWGFPEAAPLVFPTLDIVAASDHEEAKKFKDKVKKKANFVANYYDKRATAKFQGEHPDNLLSQSAGVKPKFTSRYADPNHPANSGSLISLVTGGAVNIPPIQRGFGYGYGYGYGRGIGGGFGGRGYGYGGGVAAIAEQRAAMMGGGVAAIAEQRAAMMGGGLGGGRMGMMGGGFGRGRMGMGMGGRMGMGPVQGNYSYCDDPNYPLDVNMNAQMAQQQQFMMQQQAQQMSYRGMGGGMAGRGGIGFGGIPYEYSAPMLVQKLLKRDVLYLMVVNMPSEEELEEARAEIEKMRGYKQY